jgi:hypothetical protein
MAGRNRAWYDFFAAVSWECAMRASDLSRLPSKIQMSDAVRKSRTVVFAISAIVAASFAVPATTQAAPISFIAFLDGASEAPPVPTPGFGFTTVTIDDVAHTMRVEASFSDLIGTTTVAHIHCCVATPFDTSLTAGVATTTPTFPGFPVGVTSGTYDTTFDMTLASSYNPTFITNNGGTTASAEAALFLGIVQGRAYLNIHSTFRPGGEIRGFLEQVPLPGSLPLFVTALGLMGLLGLRRRKKMAAAA